MKPRDLRVLVMHVSTRCDQACAHCSIWKSGKPGGELGVLDRVALLGEARSLGARSVLFTGGEPLLCDHLETLARAARGLGLAVQIATNGLGLSRSASWLAGLVDEVYVSLEGPEDVHDGLRGPRMFSRLRVSLGGLPPKPLRPRLIGRSALSTRNATHIEATVGAARALGLDAVSFLPIDVTSEGFGGIPAERERLLPGPLQVAELRAAIARLDAEGELGTFVVEDAAKLLGIADRLEGARFADRAFACDAPEWSSVVEVDGAVRPCFFQPRLAAGLSPSLGVVRRSPAYALALRDLGAGNPICAACVCPKRAAEGAGATLVRLGAWLGARATPRWLKGQGSAA